MSNAPELTERQKQMQQAVEKLQHYVATYSDQPAYVDYSDGCYIDDILYGLGVSLDEKYSFSDGYRKFKDLLREHLKED